MHLTKTPLGALAGLLALCLLPACGDDDKVEPTAGSGGGAPGGGTAAASYAALPEPVTAFGARVLDDKLYIHGGHLGAAHDDSVEALVAKLRRLDLSKPGAQWEEVAGPNVPIQQSALFTYGDKLYRLGGLTSKAHEGQPMALFALPDFAVYDATANTWSDLPPMPDGRSSHDVEIVGSTVYVTGGWKIAGGMDTEKYYDTWLSIDLSAAKPTWTEHKQPFLVRDHCGGVADGKVYVLGGMHSGMFPTKAEVYDPAKDSWAEGPEIPAHTPVAGFGCAAVTLNGTIYFTAAEGVVYKLNDARTGWDQVAMLKVPRLFHRLVIRSDKELIALGGGTGEEVKGTTSVESIPLK